MLRHGAKERLTLSLARIARPQKLSRAINSISLLLFQIYYTYFSVELHNGMEREQHEREIIKSNDSFCVCLSLSSILFMSLAFVFWCRRCENDWERAWRGARANKRARKGKERNQRLWLDSRLHFMNVKFAYHSLLLLLLLRAPFVSSSLSFSLPFDVSKQRELDMSPLRSAQRRWRSGNSYSIHMHAAAAHWSVDNFFN
jgi:hypothetical protein